MKRAEVIAQCEEWYESLAVTCKNDKRAGKNVTGGADPVSVFKVFFSYLLNLKSSSSGLVTNSFLMPQNNLTLLKKELTNLQTPEGLEDLADEIAPKGDSEDSRQSSSPASISEPPSESQSSSNVSINPVILHSPIKLSGSSGVDTDEHMIVDT